MSATLGRTVPGLAERLLRKYPSETVRWTRDNMGLTQTEFGQLLGGATQITVSRWERNKRARISPVYRRLLAPIVTQELLHTPKRDWPEFALAYIGETSETAKNKPAEKPLPL
jgi:transcriptional regulator with XRE-family HTH domain